MKPALALPVSVLFVLMAASSPLSAGDDQPNTHIQLVLRNLAEKKYTPPRGDYVLLAYQPVGVAMDTVVYELDAEQIVLVPGTHSRDGVVRRPLAKSKAKLLRELAALDSVQSLPRDSGKIGFDGSAFVAVIRTGDRTKMIGHWSPDAPALAVLSGILDREIQAQKGGSRPPRAGR